MPKLNRPVRAAACAAFVAAMAAAADETLPKSSPFVPATAPASAPSERGEMHELAAVSTIGTKTTVNIYDKATKKGRWIAVGETADNIKVLKFDAARQEATVRVADGPEKTLALRRASAAGTATNFPLEAGRVGLPPTPSPVPAPAAAEPAVVVATPVNSSPPPVPGSIAHQEQEARMLVSDLLEIGLAQRKAYEDAQKKAAEAAHAKAAAAAARQPPSPPVAKP